MGRAAGIKTIGLLLACLGWVAALGGASAAHGWSTIAVREVHAYRHVLELDDRLVLVRYALAETPREDEAAYGPTGAVLMVQDGAAVLGQSHPPTSGYGLAAFYWGSSEADAQVPWADSNVQVCIHGNPTLFDPPQSHCDTPPNDPDWNGSADLAATAAEIERDIKDILLALEADDPDAAPRQYVQPGGITPAGRDKIDFAFPHIASVAPGAFQISQYTATGDFTHMSSTIPGPTSLSVDGPGSAVSAGIANLGNSFGIPFLVMGIGLVVVMAIGMHMAVVHGGGDPRALLLYPFQIILAGGMIGVPPFMAAIGILVLSCMVSFGVLVNRFWPS